MRSTRSREGALACLLLACNPAPRARAHVPDATPAATAAPVDASVPSDAAVPAKVDPRMHERSLRRLRTMAQDIRERIVGISTMEELDQWKVSLDAITNRMRWAWRGTDGFDEEAFRADVAWMTGLHTTCEAIRARAPGGCDLLSYVGRETLDRCKESLGFWGLLVGSMARPRRCDVGIARMTAPLVGADLDGVIDACRASFEGLATCADDEVCRARASAIQAAVGPSPPGEDPEEAFYRALSKGRPLRCSEEVERVYDVRMSKYVAGAPSVPHTDEEE